jgi:hypothetical protein
LTQLGKGIGELGEVFGELAIRKQRLQDYKGYLEADALHTNMVADVDVALAQEKDTTQWGKIATERFKVFQKSIDELPMSQRGRDIMTSRTKAWGARLDKNIRVKAVQQQMIDTQNTLSFSIKEAFSSGNPEKIAHAKEAFEATKQEFFGKNEVLAQEWFEAHALKGLQEHYRNQAAEDPVGTYAELTAELEARKKGETEMEKYLPSSELAKLIKLSKTKTSEKETAAQILAKQRDAEVNKMAIDALVLSPNSSAFLEKLPEPYRSNWQERIAEREKVIEGGGADPFTRSYDSSVYEAIQTVLDQDPDSIEESNINEQAGKTLTIPQAQFLIERRRKLLDKDNELNNPHIKRAMNRLIDFYKDGTLDDPEVIRERILFDENVLGALIKEAEGGRLDTPEKTEKYTADLLLPYQKMRGQNVASRFLSNLGSTFSRRAWVVQKDELNRAIRSLNVKAQAEWDYQKKHSGKGKFRWRIKPQTFVKEWRSPNKIMTQDIYDIYVKWNRGNKKAAMQEARKDGWLIPEAR